jgi:hypothetical protein
MRPFACPNCLRLNHFEVRVCPDCAATLGYDPAIDRFRHLADEGTTWKDRNDDPADLVVCANNNDFGICNWLTTRDAPGGMCCACRHNRTIPIWPIRRCRPCGAKWKKPSGACSTP